MKTDKECLQCGETEQAIRKHNLYCATMSHTEAGSEVGQEWERHRFRPYTEKELAQFKAEEDYYIKQMGDFADFVANSECPHCQGEGTPDNIEECSFCRGAGSLTINDPKEG